jgi:hydrogenase small subunit
MTPFYDKLPHVDAAGLDLTADRLGFAVVAATAAGFALHGVGKAVQHRLAAASDARTGQDPEATRAEQDSDATGPAGDRSPGGGGHDAEAEDGQEL